MGSKQSLTERFSSFTEAKSLIAPGDKVVLAVSGGVDSMVMLDLFHGLSRPWRLDLVIAHVNHQLRGEESDGDEKLVREAARRYGLPVFCTRADVVGWMHSRKISKQEAARDLRYAYLEDVRQQTAAAWIATAHHADDNAETVLLNILRGTGVHGLAGIPLIRRDARLVRPMLFARRGEILSYARKRHIDYRDDSSNASPEYTRNYLRQTIVPLLEKEFGPGVCDSLNRLAATMRGFNERLDELAGERFDNVVSFKGWTCTVAIPFLLQEPLFLREEIVLRILRRLGVEPTTSKINDILDFCGHRTGQSLRISDGIVVYKDREELILDHSSDHNTIFENIPVGGTYRSSAFTLTVGVPGPVPTVVPAGGLTEYIDAEELDKILVLRSWRKGDWFVPLGMHGRKKLSDFFGDEKIPLREKKKIPILESKDRIVWVCGRRLDDRFKITARTRRAVKLTYSPTNSATAE